MGLEELRMLIDEIQARHPRAYLAPGEDGTSLVIMSRSVRYLGRLDLVNGTGIRWDNEV